MTERGKSNAADVIVADKEKDKGLPTVEDRPFSVFTSKEKWFIVGLASFAGVFSPLTANTYLPAIPTISRAFGKSTELINLTVTIYIVIQGIAPMIWGPVSDLYGRRLIFSSCLLILSLSCVGLALVPTSAYWLLMLLRCLQAAGSASTIAIGAGVISDISVPKERGGFYGIYTLGPMVGPAIGPVIGGALTEHLGWRSIFWFLCIAASGCLLVMILLFPETLRTMVGDGSVPPSTIHRPVIPVIKARGEPFYQSIPTMKPSRNPLLILKNVDILLLLSLTAIVCAVFYAFIATISTLFVNAYPFLSETEIGLCFLGVGGGMIIGSTINGKILDWEYRKIAKEVDASSGRPDGGVVGPNGGQKHLVAHNFPIEKARMRVLPILATLLVACCAGYGWCIEKQVNIAAPLIIQVVVGYTVIAIMNSMQTLMIDLFPGQGSSITACNNLVRCSLSAFVVSVIDLLIRAIGVGWTFVLIGGMTSLVIPLIYLAIRVGPAWRAKRQAQTT